MLVSYPPLLSHKIMDFIPHPLLTNENFTVYVKPQDTTPKDQSLCQRLSKSLTTRCRKIASALVRATAKFFYIISCGHIDFHRSTPAPKHPETSKTTLMERAKNFGHAALNKVRNNRKLIVNSAEKHVVGVAPGSLAHVQLAVQNLAQGKFKTAALFTGNLFVINVKKVTKWVVGSQIMNGAEEAAAAEKASMLIH